ncbi:MAG: hypothetical protein ACOCUS_00010 [Polyangiales bacterium]
MVNKHQGRPSQWLLSGGVLSPVDAVDQVRVPVGSSEAPGLASLDGGGTGLIMDSSILRVVVAGQVRARFVTSKIRLENQNILDVNNDPFEIQARGNTVMELDDTAVAADGDTAISTLRYHDTVGVATAKPVLVPGDSLTSDDLVLTVPKGS